MQISRIIAGLAVSSVFMLAVTTVARADDHFREFPDAEVVTPMELFRALAQMQDLPPELIEQARRLAQENGIPLNRAPNGEVKIPTPKNGTRPDEPPTQTPARPGEPGTPNGQNAPNQSGPNANTNNPRNSNPGNSPNGSPRSNSPATVPGQTPGSSPSAPNRGNRSVPNANGGNPNGPGRGGIGRGSGVPGSGNPGSGNPGSGNSRSFNPGSPDAPGSGGQPPSNSNTPSSPDNFNNPNAPNSPTPRSKPPRPNPRRPRAGADENFRQRMNRILMDAAKDAAQTSPEEQGDRSGFEKFLAMAQDRVEKSMKKSSPSVRRRMRSRWKNLKNNVRQPNSSTQWLSNPPTAPSLPSSGSSRAWVWLVAVLAVGVGAFLLVRQRVPHRELRSALQRARHAKQVQWMIRAIKSREDFVAAFDEFVIYSGGLQSRSWNTQTVHATLVESHPEYSKQIGELVDQYNLARYAPDNLQPSEAEKLEHNASTLHQLATRNATAPSESAAVRGV